MKFCTRPWDYCYIIDGDKGEVWPCDWLDEAPIRYGNLITEDIEEIYKSDDAKKIQNSILDGSYKYCDAKKCTFLANNNLPDLSEDEIREVVKTKVPLEFSIAYDETCNHACASCRNGYFKGCEDYYNNINAINIKMLPYYNKAKFIMINGRGEIFACKELLEMLSELKPEREDFTLVIQTNGALFDAKHWSKIEHLSKFNIELLVTVNSFVDSTYRYLNGYSNHVDKILENLAFIRELRKDGKVNKVGISMIVQEANFRELPQYVDRCLNEFNADNVRIRGIMQFGMEESDFWYKDIFNPLNPNYREAIDILNHPIMKDERVWYWEGDYENTRKPIEHPYIRFKDNCDNLWKLVNIQECGCTIKGLEAIREKKIAIYGAGHVGEYLSRIMHQRGIEPICFFDTYRDGNIGEYCIRKVDKSVKLDDIEVVINTVPHYDEKIKHTINQLGYKGEYIGIDEILRED